MYTVLKYNIHNDEFDISRKKPIDAQLMAAVCALFSRGREKRTRLVSP
jgi:hypothetical protein